MAGLKKIALAGVKGSGKSTIATLLEEKYNLKAVSLADPIKRFVLTVFDKYDNEILWGPSENRSKLISDYYTSDTFRSRYGKLPEVWADAYENLKNYAEEFLVDELYIEEDIHGLVGSLSLWFFDVYNRNLAISPRELLISLGNDWGVECVGEQVWVVPLEENIRQMEEDNTQSKSGVIVTDVRYAHEFRLLQATGTKMALILRENAKQSKHITEQIYSQVPKEAFDFVINNDWNIHTPEGLRCLNQELDKIYE